MSTPAPDPNKTYSYTDPQTGERRIVSGRELIAMQADSARRVAAANTANAQYKHTYDAAWQSNDTALAAAWRKFRDAMVNKVNSIRVGVPIRLDIWGEYAKGQIDVGPVTPGAVATAFPGDPPSSQDGIYWSVSQWNQFWKGLPFKDKNKRKTYSALISNAISPLAQQFAKERDAILLNTKAVILDNTGSWAEVNNLGNAYLRPLASPGTLATLAANLAQSRADQAGQGNAGAAVSNARSQAQAQAEAGISWVWVLVALAVVGVVVYVATR